MAENGFVSPLVPPVPPPDPQVDIDSGGDQAVDESKLSPMEKLQKMKAQHAKEISKHVSRSERLQQALERQDQLYSGLQAQIESIKNSQSRGLEEMQKPKSDLDRYTVSDLRKAEYTFLKSEDPAEREKAFSLREEISRREREEMKNEFKQLIEGERNNYQIQSESRTIAFEAAKLLGEDGEKFFDLNTGQVKNSREMKIADAIFGQLKAKRGSSAEQIPELRGYAILLAAQVAKTERAAAEKTESRQSEANMLRSRVQDQVGAKGDAAPDTIDRMNAALKTGDIDAAISMAFPEVAEAEKSRKAILARRMTGR